MLIFFSYIKYPLFYASWDKWSFWNSFLSSCNVYIITIIMSFTCNLSYMDWQQHTNTNYFIVYWTGVMQPVVIWQSIQHWEVTIHTCGNKMVYMCCTGANISTCGILSQLFSPLYSISFSFVLSPIIRCVIDIIPKLLLYIYIYHSFKMALLFTVKFCSKLEFDDCWMLIILICPDPQIQ